MNIDVLEVVLLVICMSFACFSSLTGDSYVGGITKVLTPNSKLTELLPLESVMWLSDV